ncbi:MAG: flagella basal body P-ring formation protein FlgA [Myxococcales bacterium]|nr:flagella basal body P-ring formation protein FlgA [Myxococcales bacterium]
MSRPLRSLALTLALLCAAPTASAAPKEIEVKGAHIELGEVWTDAPEDYREIDLGRAPPPGASRLLSRAAVLRQVEAAGFDPAKVEFPTSVRVRSAARKLTSEELEELVTPAISEALKTGIELKKVSVSRGVTLPPDATLQAVEMPKPPKRRGAYRTSAIIKWVSDSETVARVPVSVTLYITDRGASADIEKGANVTLVIERKGARITARGQALTSGDAGDVIQVRVLKTNKVLRARIESEHVAKVEES